MQTQNGVFWKTSLSDRVQYGTAVDEGKVWHVASGRLLICFYIRLAAGDDDGSSHSLHHTRRPFFEVFEVIFCSSFPTAIWPEMRNVTSFSVEARQRVREKSCSLSASSVCIWWSCFISSCGVNVVSQWPRAGPISRSRRAKEVEEGASRQKRRKSKMKRWPKEVATQKCSKGQLMT